MKVGDICRWDGQADPFGGRYQIVRHIEGDKWEIEILPADDETTEAIFGHWLYAEEHGFMTTPIWDKTWNECAEGECPQRIGWKTYEQELEEDLARYAEASGRRMTIKIVSAAEYASHF